MKKYLVLLAAAWQLQAVAQVPKKVVAELFTNTKCGSCASQEPGIQKILRSSPQVLAVSYYPSSPYSSCYFSQQNAAEYDGRANYYGVYGSTPRVVLQGVPLTQSLDTSKFNPLLNQTTPYEIKITHTMLGSDSAAVHVVVYKRSADATSNGVIFVAAQEDSIDYNASNGIKRHYGVFRKTLTAIGGLSVTLPAAIGDSITYTKYYAVNAAWSKAHLVAYAILQKTNKDVLQAESEKLQQSTTAINEVATPLLRVFPNPVFGRLYVDAADGAPFQVISTDGQLVLAGELDAQKISIEQLPAGMYVLRVRDGRVLRSAIFQKL